jgi:hypothetical protein
MGGEIDNDTRPLGLHLRTPFCAWLIIDKWVRSSVVYTSEGRIVKSSDNQ